MAPSAQTTGNIAVYVSAKHLVIQFMVLTANQTEFWGFPMAGAFSIVTALIAHLRMTDQWSGTICEILVECIIRNNSVIFFLICVSGSRDVV